jgi:hypothetical protein
MRQPQRSQLTRQQHQQPKRHHQPKRQKRNANVVADL